MDKIEIYSSKQKYLLLLIGSTLFVIGGAYLFMNAENSHDSRIKNAFIIQGIAISIILFCGLGIYVSIRPLIKDRLILVIDKIGLNVNPNKLSSERIEWKNIEGFSELKIQSSKFVIIDVNNSDYWIEREENMLKKKLMKFNLNNYGSPFNLSANSMQINYVELMELLNNSLTRYK